MEVEPEGCLTFQRFFLLAALSLHLVSSLVGILHVLDGLEERTDNSGLLVGIEVPRLQLHLSLCIPVPLRVLLRIVFLLELIGRLVELLRPGGRLEHGFLIVTLVEVLVLNLE